jgi:hypothetical protein
MGLHEMMLAVRELTKEEQALLIKHTVNVMGEDGKTLDPRLEAMLEASWQEHLADPSKSLPAREVLAKMMKESFSK